MHTLLPDVLLNLSKISATVHIGIPVLEFLSTPISLPTMSGRTEMNYMDQPLHSLADVGMKATKLSVSTTAMLVCSLCARCGTAVHSARPMQPTWPVHGRQCGQPLVLEWPDGSRYDGQLKGVQDMTSSSQLVRARPVKMERWLRRREF